MAKAVVTNFWLEAGERGLSPLISASSRPLRSAIDTLHTPRSPARIDSRRACRAGQLTWFCSAGVVRPEGRGGRAATGNR